MGSFELNANYVSHSISAVWSMDYDDAALEGVGGGNEAVLVWSDGSTDFHINTGLSWLGSQSYDIDPDTIPEGTEVDLSWKGVSDDDGIWNTTSYTDTVPHYDTSEDDPEVSGWSNLVTLTAGMVAPPVTNLIGNVVGNNWVFSWDKYTVFVPDRYNLQWRHSPDGAWSNLAYPVPSEDARQTISIDFSAIDGILEFEPYDFRVRAERNTGA